MSHGHRESRTQLLFNLVYTILLNAYKDILLLVFSVVVVVVVAVDDLVVVAIVLVLYGFNTL